MLSIMFMPGTSTNQMVEERSLSCNNHDKVVLKKLDQRDLQPLVQQPTPPKMNKMSEILR